MPTLHIQLLGDLSITLDGQELLSGRGNTRAALLLAHLLLKRDRRQSRKQIAYLFWKDSTDKQARSNLRGLLTALRKQAPVLAAHLIIDETHLCWRSDPTQALDVAEFESALEYAAALDQRRSQTGNSAAGGSAAGGSAAGGSAADQTANTVAVVDALKKAVALYTGELLPAFYEDWVLAERHRLQTVYLDALLWLIDLLEKSGRNREAIHYAELLWQIDPLRETSIFLLMRLCASVGDRARALALYANCARLLVEELGVEPGPAIEDLHRRLLQEPEQHTAVNRQHTAVNIGKTPNDKHSADMHSADAWVEDMSGDDGCGRASPWEQLLDAWRAASAGAAQIVVLSGEAGIGKSHLARQLRDWCSTQGAVVLATACPQARTPAPYVALAPLLASPPLAHRLERMDDTDLACLQMLSPALRHRYALRRLDSLSPRWLQLRLQQALTLLLADPTQPTLLILDDAQWCDEQSFEWLHYLFTTEPDAPLLVLMAVSEGDFDEMPFGRACAALLAKGHLRRVEIQRLSMEETACLAQRVAARPLDEDTIARLYAASAGNPFFVIELVRMLDNAHGAALAMLADGALPASVSALIAHRLAALSHLARQLLEVAAVIGQHFSLALLRRVDSLSEESRIEALDELWRCGLIIETGGDVCSFCHDLVREVVYRQLSDVRRRHLHQRTAEAMIELAASDFSDILADDGDLIAGHFALAGRIEEAAQIHDVFVQSILGDATLLQRWS